MEPLVGPPRRLNRGDERALLWGQTPTLLGALALSTAAAAIWILVAGYGLTFSTLRHLAGPRTKYPAFIESSRPLQIWTGETVQWTSAIFEVDGTLYRAQCFHLPMPPLVEGQVVTALAPQNHPEEAWIAGGQKFPVRLRSLLRIAAVFLLPACGLTLWGLLLGHRRLRLARHGQEVTASRRSHTSLPRPLTDHFFDRWDFTDQAGTTRSTWSVSTSSQQEESMLILDGSPAQAVRRSALLPDYRCDNGVVTGIALTRRRSYRLVLALWALQAAILGVFFLT